MKVKKKMADPKKTLVQPAPADEQTPSQVLEGAPATGDTGAADTGASTGGDASDAGSDTPVADAAAQEVTEGAAAQTPEAPAADSTPAPEAAAAAPVVAQITTAPAAPVLVSHGVQMAAGATIVNMNAGSAVGASILNAKIVQEAYEGADLSPYSQDLKDLIVQMYKSGSAIAKTSITDLLEYCRTMGPGNHVTLDNGPQRQVQLYRSLQNSVNNGGDDFRLMFAIMLRIILETKDKGAFQIRYAFRFFPDMNLGKEDADAFQKLLHVLIALCDPSGRATSLKQVDLGRAFAKGFTDAGRQRILAFFTL